MSPRSGSATEISSLAGEVRTEVGRLAFHLRTPATRSGITPTRLAALATIAHFPDGLRQGELAELMNVSAPSMTRLVEILIEAGWVDRRRDPADQRCLTLALSPLGSTTLAAVRDESAAELSEAIAALDPEERAALATAVPVLRKLADRQLDG